MPDGMDPDDRDLAESMHDFEAAVSARRFDLEPPALNRILVAIDGSNQSAFALGLAAELAGRSSAKLHVAYAYPGASEPERDRDLAAQVSSLAQAGLDVVAAARAEAETPPYERILELAAALDPDLLIVPAPYLEDLEELGADSIGVTLDKLMGQVRPLLVVREPRDDPQASLRPVLLAVTVYVEENSLAGAWALRVIGEGGMIRVVAVVEEGVIEALGEHAAADVDLDRLAGLGRPDTAGLIAELHREARERSLGCRVSVRRGDLVQRVIEVAEQDRMLIVTGCDADPSSASYRNVQAIIRRSRDPVLVV